MPAVDRNWRQIVSSIFLIRSEPAPWVPAAFWLLVATVSVGGAVFVALQPGRMQDLHQVRSWLHYWTASGLDPYDRFGASLDYPPMAFLVLWPLGLPSTGTIAYWFLPVAIATTVLAGWALLRWMGERMYVDLGRAERIALVALMLASNGVRISLWRGQTVALSLLFGALAMRWKRRRPYAAALALALCSFKPHVALGFGLAILLIEGSDVIILAGAMTLSLSLLFALTTDDSLLGIGLEYVRNLLTLYSGSNRVRGMLSIRFVLDDLIGSSTLATSFYVILAIASLTMLVVLSRRRRRDAVTQTHVAAGCILWSVVFLPHQLYNNLLAAPALWLLMWPEGGIIKGRALRAAAVAAYVIFGVLGVPEIIRAVFSAEFDWIYFTSYDLSPLRIAALFALILWSLHRRPQPDCPGGVST